MRLHDLLQGLSARIVRGDAEVRVLHLAEDSRAVAPGTLFFARKGTRTDGRRFVPDALSAGAVAVVTDDPVGVEAPCLVHCPDLTRALAEIAERFHNHPSRTLDLVGITGTNGKTSTTFVVRHLLAASGVRCGLMGTILVDDGRHPLPASLTTPPALEISAVLASMVAAGCKACAMEASSHALAQDRVAALRFRAAVFTNLTGDHLDFHGTMDAYADAKARLFDALSPDSTAIVNADDPAHARMIRGTPARVWRCSLDRGRGSECRAEVATLGVNGTDAALVGPWGRIDARLALVGRHNVMNVLQGVAAAFALGLTRDELAEALGSVSAPPGRLEPVGAGSPTVLVDYAHTDDALEKALLATRALADANQGRLWVVFGCGGDRDRTKRPRMGATAARLADRVVVTSDNPRTETPRAIIDEILRGIPPDALARTSSIDDRAAAIGHAIASASDQDVVVIAGKGHEDYQILPDGRGGTTRRPFSDRESAARALAARLPRAGAR